MQKYLRLRGNADGDAEGGGEEDGGDGGGGGGGEKRDGRGKQPQRLDRTDPTVVALAAHSWFRAKCQHDFYWLNHALRDSASKRTQKNAVRLDKQQKKLFKRLIRLSSVTMTPLDGTKAQLDAKQLCLELLLHPSSICAQPTELLVKVALCCNSPHATVVQKQMLRYCVHMQQNLAKDFICLGFCLETIAVRHDLTLESILLEGHPHVDIELLNGLVDLAFGVAAAAAPQYLIFTRNVLWTKEERDTQRRANGKIFAHRYRDLQELVTLAGNVDGRPSAFIAQFKSLYDRAVRDVAVVAGSVASANR